jgi:hypothetical protein
MTTATLQFRNEFTVVRFDDDVNIALRKHSLTQGNVQGRWPNSELAHMYLDTLPDNVASLMHAEDRSEEWEEEVECSCATEVEIDGWPAHHEDCAIIQMSLAPGFVPAS